jgi:Domain of unknown function (DUF4738)
MKMLQLEGIYLYLKTKIKQMKKLLLLLFVLIFVSYSCKNKTENHIEEQKKTIGNKKSKTISNNIIFEKDSTKGSFEISYKITTKKDSISYQFFEDNEKKETSYVKDNQIDLLIKYKKQIILNNTIIKEKFKNFINENLDNYQLAIFNINEISNTSCTFFINICVPDSDNCFTFNYTIFSDGSEKIIELENEIED